MSTHYHDPAPIGVRMNEWRSGLSRQTFIASVLFIALFAFEIFNFDTTRFALTDFLGDVSFAGFRWAAILAVAFCAIDFAGLVRMFTPEKGADEPKEVWYLMGAWLLGATMNAVMTWWAVSLTLLAHGDFGNEVLGRATLLKVVPIFVAVLVWLTRVLFIGAVSMTGEKLMDMHRAQRGTAPRQRFVAQPPANAVKLRERPASESSRAKYKRKASPAAAATAKPRTATVAAKTKSRTIKRPPVNRPATRPAAAAGGSARNGRPMVRPTVQAKSSRR